MPSDRPAHCVIVIVGGGPRGTGVLERILAHESVISDPSPVTVHVVDPFPAGAGRIWRGSQAPLLWMNSTSADVTMFTDETTVVTSPIRPGPTLAEWVAANRDELATHTEIADEVPGVTPASFASRSLQSRYLTWAFDSAVDNAPDHVDVRVHRQTATDVVDNGRTQSVHLDNGEILDATVVLLTQGHPDALPAPRETRLADFASDHGLTYVGPGYTADLDADVIPAGEPVLVAGLGLAFIDWMVLLAETRGGRFERSDDGTLHYTPSGREPLLYAGSRRGVPYHSKISYSIADARPPLPRFFTADLIPGDGLLDFRRDIWPPASKELAGAHYHELFASHPDRTVGSWEEFDSEFSSLPWGSPRLTELVENTVPKPEDRFDLERLNRPLGGERYDGLAQVQTRLGEYITADVARRSDQYFSADAAVFSALLSVYMTVGELLRRGRIPAKSVAEDVEGRLHSFFSFIASGPPPERLEQLLALNEAGVVQFLGPDTAFSTEIDPANGAGLFVARSASHTDIVATRTLIEARLPVASISTSADALLRNLHGRGEAVELRATEDSAAKLAVDGTSRILNQDGSAHPRRFAAGPWVAGHNWSAAFPRPRTNAGFFRHNDALAAEVLSTCAPFR
ncbi:putative NAD(P)/FAD-binding protein YdhS [Rhodococcus sp. 27YEA15]|uniref:FAD/NAD(P)-binding protein n=1 Tax=Rhodococcus sp. 27YEA15 TaxID=3156259 RepID=UPI003C7D64B9